MKQYWGTLSILDHRAKFFKPSLLLFDGLVMPVPTCTYKDLSDPKELEQLDKDAKALSKAGCAVPYRWDPAKFEEWRTDYLAAGIATRVSSRSAENIKTDKLLDTRYQLQEAVKSGEITIPNVNAEDVSAIPVFGARKGYQNLPPSNLTVDPTRQVTVDLILKQLPVPTPETPLSAIIELRKQGAIQEAVRKLRIWQLDLMMDLDAITDVAQRDLRLEKAELELQAAIADYEQAMDRLNGDIVKAWITTLVSAWKDPVGCLTRLGTVHRDRFTFKSEHELAWKTLHAERFAFAGAIVAFKDL